VLVSALLHPPATALENAGVPHGANRKVLDRKNGDDESWDDESPNIWKNNPNVPNNQPATSCMAMLIEKVDEHNKSSVDLVTILCSDNPRCCDLVRRKW
jgi:hypothetical protein